MYVWVDITGQPYDEIMARSHWLDERGRPVDPLEMLRPTPDLNYTPDPVDTPPLVPGFQGNDVIEHFKTISEEVAEPYYTWAHNFARAKLPPRPKEWIMQAGWTRYAADGTISQVPCPLEVVFPRDWHCSWWPCIRLPMPNERREHQRCVAWNTPLIYRRALYTHFSRTFMSSTPKSVSWKVRMLPWRWQRVTKLGMVGARSVYWTLLPMFLWRKCTICWIIREIGPTNLPVSLSRLK